jgi:CheY-like chemotaxis protein
VLYDVILMDIQLPNLDGVAAARAIRTLPEHSHTPILALTANAFVEDREQCLAAGMNGHISKPATRAMLALELSNWLATAEDPAGPSPDDGHHAANLGTAAPELDGGAMLAGVHAGADLREDLFAAYVRLHRHDVVSLRDHVANGQYTAARELLHTLEGSAAMVGARGIRAAAAALAAALRADSDAATCRQLAVACEREFDALAASLSIAANAAGEGPGDGRGAAACA